MKRYFWNILISIDQFANTVFGGYPDETISSRAGKLRKTCKFCHWLCLLLHRVDPGHCEKSIELDEGEK